MAIRCFDLGGSGLKTCVFDNDLEEPVVQNLGKSEVLDIAKWIRKALPTLEVEINQETCFSFSLAGLDKLTNSGHNFDNRRDFESISRLFKLSPERVFTQTDGDAHLLA